MLNLAGVFAGEETLPFETRLDLSELEFSGARPFQTPVVIRGTAANHAGVVMIELTASYSVCAPCDRCAVEVHREEKLPLSYVVVQNVEGEDTEDFVVAKDMKVDIEALVRDDIILRFPMKFLCKPDCKGICPKCGKNLNEGVCGCEIRSADPRLDALKGFFN